MTKGKELTDAQKGAILALLPLYSHAEIGARLGIYPDTITKFVKHAQECDSIKNLPRPGRPRKLSNAAVRYLVRNAESESRVPFKELRNSCNIDVSIQTMRRRLQEEGIRKWRAVKRPLLTQKHANERLAWARAHQIGLWMIGNMSFGQMRMLYRRIAMVQDTGFFGIKINGKSMRHRMYA